MADNKVVPYDPAKLMDAVRDRIKAEFVGLIPEETWKQMVAAEVKRFLEPEQQSNAYYNDRKPLPSGFQRVVWEELEKATRERMKAFLSSPEWIGEWDSQGGMRAGDAVKKLVTEKSGEILASVLGGAIQGTIESMRQRI